jgi:hypothetical protein
MGQLAFVPEGQADSSQARRKAPLGTGRMFGDASSWHKGKASEPENLEQSQPNIRARRLQYLTCPSNGACPSNSAQYAVTSSLWAGCPKRRG